MLLSLCCKWNRVGSEWLTKLKSYNGQGCSWDHLFKTKSNHLTQNQMAKIKKLLDLDEDTINKLTKEGIKHGIKNFKNYAEFLLENKAKTLKR